MSLLYSPLYISTDMQSTLLCPCSKLCTNINILLYTGRCLRNCDFLHPAHSIPHILSTARLTLLITISPTKPTSNCLHASYPITNSLLMTPTGPCGSSLSSLETSRRITPAAKVFIPAFRRKSSPVDSAWRTHESGFESAVSRSTSTSAPFISVQRQYAHDIDV